MRDPKFFPERDGECVSADYSLNEDGTLKVYNSHYNTVKEARQAAEALAECTGPQCSLKFGWVGKGDYRVVSTDYTTYSIVYSCSELFGIKVEYIWVLARPKTLSEKQLGFIKEIIAREIPDYNLEEQHFTYQGEDCDYGEAHDYVSSIEGWVPQ